MFLKILQYLQENTCLESLFNKLAGLQHRCFSVNIAKFLRTPILKSICEQLLLESTSQLQLLSYPIRHLLAQS